MSDNESPAGSPPQTLHEEAKDDEPKDQELGDYDVEAAGDSDKNSPEEDDLSDIDEDQFGDYDPAAAQIEEKPVEIDEDVARTLKAGKRKGLATKKPKEGRREKKKRRRDEEENDGADGEIVSGKRSRKAAAPASKKPSPEPIDESTLTPEERRRRAIERAAQGEVKNKVKRRKKDEVVCCHFLRFSCLQMGALTIVFRTSKPNWTNKSLCSRQQWRTLVVMTTIIASKVNQPSKSSSFSPRSCPC